MLAATTGVVAASVISMGLISLPIMLRYGYDRRVASGVIAASGTLTQIIPPSLVLIVLADQLGRSVGDLYKGAFIRASARLYSQVVASFAAGRRRCRRGAHDPRSDGAGLRSPLADGAHALRDGPATPPTSDRRLDARRRLAFCSRRSLDCFAGGRGTFS